MSASIHPFTMSDYDAACSLWKRSEGIGLSAADSRENIQIFLERNPGMSFTARQDGRLVGAVLCGSDGRRGFLYHLAVDPAVRRQKLGMRLVRACLTELDRCGLRKCHIFVIAGNQTGKRFWREIGWEERTDLVVMSRDVAAGAACEP
jgi:N-acetylglutamate synthase